MVLRGRDAERGARFPNGLIEMMNRLDGQIKELDAVITRLARAKETARSLMTTLGIGPLKATGLVAESGQLK